MPRSFTIRGKKYDTAQQAAVALGVTAGAIYTANRQGRLDTVGLRKVYSPREKKPAEVEQVTRVDPPLRPFIPLVEQYTSPLQMHLPLDSGPAFRPIPQYEQREVAGLPFRTYKDEVLIEEPLKETDVSAMLEKMAASIDLMQRQMNALLLRTMPTASGSHSPAPNGP